MIVDRLNPLTVHVILQGTDGGTDTPARRLATDIYARLNRGPRHAGVPVHIWIGLPSSSGPLLLPRQPVLRNAARNAIILLVDQLLFGSRKDWQPYFEELGSMLNRERDLLLPVSIGVEAQRVSSVVSNINCVPIKDPETIVKDEDSIQAILTAILRLLPEAHAHGIRPPAPSSLTADVFAAPRIFLCHAKSDGDLLARTLRTYTHPCSCR
jgi:hypothetical protein